MKKEYGLFLWTYSQNQFALYRSIQSFHFQIIYIRVWQIAVVRDNQSSVASSDMIHLQNMLPVLDMYLSRSVDTITLSWIKNIEH